MPFARVVISGSVSRPRGRLFTVSTAGGGLRAVDSIDAFPPGASGQGDWYDEMLISDDRVIVIGYSYGRGGTEINRFRLSPDGRLRFEDAWHLKSNDYYSSRNYASRLIGTRLVLYTPLYLNWRNDPLEALPGLRRWRPGIERGAPFRPIAGPAQVYVAPDMGRNPEARIDALHSVTSCDLSADDLACSAVAVLGPESRTFYVSPSGVYLWIADWMTREPRRGESRAFLYRLPFGGAAPTALAAEGMPVDQFSFREDGNDGMINVLLRAEGGEPRNLEVLATTGGAEGQLIYRNWVESRRAYVDSISGGRIGYVHIASMSIDLGGVFRFFTRADKPGQMHAIVGSPSPMQIVRNLGRMHSGKPLQSPKIVDRECRSMTVEATGGELLAPIIDGECYQRVKKLSFSRGPRLRIPKITGTRPKQLKH